jgi:hypothetical protein
MSEQLSRVYRASTGTGEARVARLFGQASSSGTVSHADVPYRVPTSYLLLGSNTLNGLSTFAYPSSSSSSGKQVVRVKLMPLLDGLPSVASVLRLSGTARERASTGRGSRMSPRGLLIWVRSAAAPETSSACSNSPTFQTDDCLDRL